MFGCSLILFKPLKCLPPNSVLTYDSITRITLHLFIFANQTPFPNSNLVWTQKKFNTFYCKNYHFSQTHSMSTYSQTKWICEKKSLRGENSMWFSMEKKESVTTLRLSVCRSVVKTCWRNAWLRHEKWYMKYEYIPSWKSTENSANICFARRGLDFMVFHYFVLEFVAKHRPYFLYNTFSLSTLKPWS